MLHLLILLSVITVLFLISVKMHLVYFYLNWCFLCFWIDYITVSSTFLHPRYMSTLCHSGRVHFPTSLPLDLTMWPALAIGILMYVTQAKSSEVFLWSAPGCRYPEDTCHKNKVDPKTWSWAWYHRAQPRSAQPLQRADPWGWK